MDVFRYNVRWTEQTFITRQITEHLLAPERENGNVTTHDYDAAINFFPGFHRHYRLVGGTLAIPLLYTVRKPSWSNTRSYFFLTAASFTGFMIGHVMSLSAHFNFVRSVENPGGFSQAMDNIQKNIGSFPPPGPVIIRQGGKWTVDHDSSVPPPDTPPVPRVTTDTVPNNPISKWNQIRAANSRISTNSSWDLLRQNHERARVAASPDNDDFDRFRGNDRAAEQAEFDKVLERERNIK